MPRPIKPNDFVRLALALRPILVNHKVPPESRASLIEDLVFQVAVFVDEKTGSDFHEVICGILQKHAKKLGAAPEPSDYPVAELQVVFSKGRRAELNVSRVSLRKPAILRMNLEVALGIRDITEIRSRIDTRRRFSDVVWKKKGGIKALRFKSAANRLKPSWLEVRLPKSRYGSFEQSLDGLVSCIKAVTAQWI